MTKHTNRFAFDWWVVQKRAVYIIIAVLVLCGLAGGAALYVWKYGNPLKNVGAKTKFPAGARFSSFEGDVRVIRAATRETIVANSDTELYPGDTVQTGANGRARLSMADGSTLVVRPNSTIIVRDNTSSDDGKKTNVHVMVDSGQMSVRTEQQNEGTSNVVETPRTKNKVGEQTGASFAVNAEGTEEIRVNAGTVEATDHAGEKTQLHGGDYASVSPPGKVSRPQKLLDVPLPSEPHDLQQLFAPQGGAATVTLKWQRPQSGVPAYYRLEVATSPFFVSDGKVIERDQLAATEFSASDLRPGNYFWRVRATASSGQTSDWCEPQKFIVTPRGTGSHVAASDLAVELLGGSIYLVRGHAEPGTIIRVAGKETIVPTEKAFQLQITAPAGAREITLSAQDAQGNSSQYKLPLPGK
jgi:hypothetical protein